ncbi:Os10g0438300 [Oryza sativa Japonica Group]|uniref:Os10g0438300 protein n=1 Tax=Oryza sativa subsp. japonica TaxID=39947 RepID=A0A0P0XV27_ORYSJ|nr:Os10g0438300 [Oryza sativa Japonica Group]
MAASSSNPTPLLLPPPPPQEPAPLSPPPPLPTPKPIPTVADNFRSLLRSGEALLRFAFRGNSGQLTHRHPPPPRPPPQQQHPHHHNRPAEIMKRLQREKFADMIKHMDGHEQIDRLVALYTSSAKGFHLPELPVRVKVALDAAGALLLVDGDELEQARDRLAKARNTTGLGSRFVFESSTRGGKDTVAAELATGLGAAAAAAAGGRPLELTRLQYCAHVSDLLSMTLVPFGAQCNNFLHGSSLIQSIQSRALSGGPPSYSERHDCGAGVSIKGSRFRASIAELIFGSPGEHGGGGGGGNGDHEVPNRLTTFGKGSVAAAAAAATAPSSHTVAVMVDCDMYDTLRAEGWVEMETAAAATPARRRGPVARWGVCVSDCPEHELGWGVRIGGTAERNAHRPHVEGFLSFDLGKGGRVQPGLVIAMDGDKRTPALVLRSSWLM